MITYLILWAAIFLAYFFYQQFIKPLNYWKKQNVPQGNPVWGVGHNTNLFLRNRSPPEQSQYIYNQCPGKRYMGTYDFTKPRLLLRDPELIKQMNVKDFEHFSDRPVFVPPKIEPLWSRNLFALNGIKWRKMRSILSPSFTSSKMKVIYNLIQDCSESFIQYFNQKDQDVIEVGMKEIFTRFTNDVIATSAFGIKVDSLRNPNNEFYIMGRRLLNIGGLMFLIRSFVTKLIPSLGIFFPKGIFDKKAMNFFYTTINETVNIREKQNIIRPDMIHLLIEARKGINQIQEKDVIDTGFATVQETITETNSQDEITLTNSDIAAQAVVFFFAGFDTVSSLLMFMSYELAVNPDIQNRLRDEILQTRDECEGKLTYEALLKMKYMDMVISEALRKWPNVHALQRMCSKPYTIQPVLPGETAVHIETGAQIIIPVFAIHRDPKQYPNPEKFDPERFNDENKKYINPYIFMPFGVGPRNCIGSRMALLETKLMFYHLLLNFEIVPVEATRIPPKLDPMSVRFEIQGDIYLGFKRINN